MANDVESKLKKCPIRAGLGPDERCQESDCMMWYETDNTCLVKHVLHKLARHLPIISGSLNDIAGELRQARGVLQARLPK